MEGKRKTAAEPEAAGSSITVPPSLLETIEGLGFAKDEALRQARAILAKFPDGNVPLQYIENIVRPRITAAVITNVVTTVSAALLALAKEGKGPIRRDPTAHA